jgi:hypothetical protein
MPVKSKRKKVLANANYALCELKFRGEGVVMKFDPVKKTTTKDGFDEFIRDRKSKKKGQLAGAKVARLPNGQIKDHVRDVSKSLPTKLAYCLETNSSWKFVPPGFEAGNPQHKGRFSGATISANGKVVEVTFEPERVVKNYPYNLWLEADVVGMGGKKAPTVTVIVDPVVRSSIVP